MTWLRFGILFIIAVILSFALSGTAFAQNQSSNSNRPAQTMRTQVAAPSKSEDLGLEGFWNLRLTHRRLQSEYNQATVSEFRVLGDLTYRRLENLYFRFAPKFSYTTGYIESQEGKDGSISTWGVQEASINAEPFKEYLLLSTGALNQNAMHPSLLLEDQAFPAVRVRVQTSPKDFWSIGAEGEAAIPTSSSLSTQTSESEKTPSYSSGSGFANLNQGLFEAKLRAGVYQFQDLPRNVATKSTYLGNTTVSNNGADSEFVYEYKGTFASGSATGHLTRRWALTVSGDWVQNSQAPSTLNQGLRTRAETSVDVTRNSQVTPFYEYFKIEPDAVVALYNGEWLTTNRVGYNGGLTYSYRKSLKMTLMGGERDAVYTSPFQRKEQTWFFRLETFDVAI